MIPHFQELPRLSTEEYDLLQASIKDSGVRHPILICATTGCILDGHHRKEIADTLGLDCPSIKIYHMTSDAQRRAYGIRVNLERRHLSTEQRKVLTAHQKKLAKQLKKEGKTQEEVARMLGVQQGTISKWIRPIIPGNNRSNGHKISLNDQRVKLNKKAQRTVYKRVEAGETQQQVADDIKISQRQVGRIHGAIKKKEEAKVIQQDAVTSYSATDINLFAGDFRKVSCQIEDGSVDLILTDPPYPKKDLPLYGDLAEMATRKLSDKGILLVYAGNIFLPEVMTLVSEHLTYIWTFCLSMIRGSQSRIFKTHVLQAWKPILAFTKGGWHFDDWYLDMIESPCREKGEYEWQQNIIPARTMIQRYSSAGSLVMDPFLGVGTFGLAARLECRRFIGIEQDIGRYNQAKQRILNGMEDNHERLNLSQS